MKDDEILFSIKVGRIQLEAMNYINRKLTEDELLYVKKGLEAGFDFDIDIVFETAIDDAVELCRNKRKNKRK
jgi:hypothetical protein